MPNKPRNPIARKHEAEAGFAIGVYDEGILESNADERFGRHGDVADRQRAEGEGLINTDNGTKAVTITQKGWDQLNEDIRRIEANALNWMGRKFIQVRDEGHGQDDLVGTFWFDPTDEEQAWLVDLAADTGRQERIDMVDTSYGDLANTVFDGVSDFGASVLGGGITFFDVKPEDMEVVEQTLEHERRRSTHEAPRRPRYAGEDERWIINSLTDIRTYVSNVNPGGVYGDPEAEEAMVRAIQAANHPSYGRDWSGWLNANVDALARKVVTNLNRATPAAPPRRPVGVRALAKPTVRARRSPPRRKR